MKKRILGMVTVLTSIAVVSLVHAHHSNSSVYDMKTITNITGVLTEIEWVNPHILFHVDVKDKNGTTKSWTIERSPPIWYRNSGIRKKDFEKGLEKEVTLEILPAMNKEPFGFFRQITFDDGTKLRVEREGLEKIVNDEYEKPKPE